ncbi:MAG: type III polyketide synthase, partial [Mesorhizobium sp.]
MSANAYINRIATAVPEHEVHQFYLRFAASMLAASRRR